jgi:hypothetical protein
VDDASTVAQLRTLIERSGLSASAFARDVLIREPRTIRRWLAGDSPIPTVVVAWVKRRLTRDAPYSKDLR